MIALLKKLFAPRKIDRRHNTRDRRAYVPAEVVLLSRTCRMRIEAATKNLTNGS